MSCYVLVYHQKMPSHAISEHVIFKISWGGMPPDPPSIACFTCWLCFAQQSYLDTCSYNFKFGSYFFGLTTSNLLPPALCSLAAQTAFFSLTFGPEKRVWPFAVQYGLVMLCYKDSR